MNFVENVNKNCGEYGSLPFWSWNDKLSPKELRRQIKLMKDLKMNGFFMHARGGLETEYLSDDWFNCVNECIDEAEKQNMQAWSYDENGWPSGFAGGKILEDRANWATYLTYETSDKFPTESTEDKILLGVYVLSGGKIIKTETDNGSKEYIAIYQKFDSSYVDVTDDEITRKFIKETHEEYKKRTGDTFGKRMPGFFTDEPQYYRYATPWSNKFPEVFKEKYGYDVLSMLPALFIDCEGDKEFRYDYYTMLHKRFIENWIKVIYDWCNENGCQITGHAIEESCLFAQMWCCGGIMPFYEYESIPGVDYLSRNIGNDVAGKQVGSVAAQLGKKKVLSEMFACCGWDVTPTELKTIAELQYASGVNIMCQHLYAYSIRGQRKRDYPANYSEHLPWQPAMKEFNEYFNRLGYILAQGKEAVNTLIIHPIHSAYLTYKRQEDIESIRPIEEGFSNITDYFSNHQIPYHFGDEELMEKYGSVEGSKIKIGLCEYKYVVLPLTYSLEPSTVKLLKEFIKNGGKVYLFDKKPERTGGRIADMSWLSSNISFEEIAEDANAVVRAGDNICSGLKCMTRDTDYGRIFYFVNVSKTNYENVSVKLKGVSGKLCEVRLESCDWNQNPVVIVDSAISTGDCVSFETSFEPSESKMFIEYSNNLFDQNIVNSRKEEKAAKASLISSDGFRLVKSPENAITLDNAEISYDGINYEHSRSILLIFDMLLRKKYKGDLYLKFKFNVKEIPDSLNVCVEPMKYKSFKVNGNDITFEDGYWLDRSFKRADILKYTKTGENEIIMSFEFYQRDYVYYVLYSGVSESLRNCLAFDTEIENIYLFGNFALSTDQNAFEAGDRLSYSYSGAFEITKAKDSIDISNVVLDGYPFLAGLIEAEKDFESDGLPCSIKLNGRFSYADVYINGIFVKKLIFTNHCDISEYVKPGKNTLKIVLCNSNRNLLGPHHFADPEPHACGPVTFSLENLWHDEQCAEYRARYAFVKFGTEIEII